MKEKYVLSLAFRTNVSIDLLILQLYDSHLDFVDMSFHLNQTVPEKQKLIALPGGSFYVQMKSPEKGFITALWMDDNYQKYLQYLEMEIKKCNANLLTKLKPRDCLNLSSFSISSNSSSCYFIFVMQFESWYWYRFFIFRRKRNSKFASRSETANLPAGPGNKPLCCAGRVLGFCHSL